MWGRQAGAAESGGPDEATFWAAAAGEVLARLGSCPDGLAATDAERRLQAIGPNEVAENRRSGLGGIIARQFASPLVLILVFGSLVALVLREWVDAAIILCVVLASTGLGVVQEHRAGRAVAALKRRLAVTARVLRDGRETPVPFAAVVPGDVVLLSAGNLVPGDGIVLDAADFLVSEASLTGESYPVEKRPGIAPATAAPGERTNAVFLGSSVRSGTAKVVIVLTGGRTAYGAIAARVDAGEPPTDFQRGVARFGGMLLRIMFVVVLTVLAANAFLGRPVDQSLLFAVALAVGLSPELLPAIVTVTLASGARTMAGRGVIVRRLEAIENFGSMSVLCTDKTGTLTEGTIVLSAAQDSAGAPSDSVLRLAFLNAAFETGIANPLDTALVAAGAAAGLSAEGSAKVDEIPYDFTRRRLTIVLARGGADGHEMIAKGAFAEVLAVCDRVQRGDRAEPLDAAGRAGLAAIFEDRSAAGLRVLAVATKLFAPRADYDRADEAAMTFRGFLVFQDPPKADAASAIGDLARLGISIKIISGDNRFVTAHVARAVGLDATAMLTGSDIAAMNDEALSHIAPRTGLFVEIDPQQKERIVRALQRTGHSVGYLGDGINDALALHDADVGISVAEAVDVARESADVILTRRDLDVLRQGVEGGRRTFANTLKYISITTSANFGNMVSMALATPFLPFLPLAPKQILLNNFLSDLPSMAISSDTVDPERVTQPQQWDVREITIFMVVFGLVSSAFDIMAFAVLLAIFHAGEALFQTAWFMISLLTELAVVLVLRTRRPALRSRPSRLLLWSTLAVAALTFAAPVLGKASTLFGFVSLSLAELGAIVVIVGGYIVATEIAKRVYFRRRRLGAGGLSLIRPTRSDHRREFGDDPHR